MPHAFARFLLAVLLLSFVAVRAESLTAAAPSSAWLPVDSDLPRDPLLRDGVLPNGIRYLILPNGEPKNQVSLRLVVGVGSLEENDDERGLAHFVEHMAFRGTHDFPNGTMAETLQRLGIAFGPDSTAFTSFVHTIYHLEVPTAHDSTLQVALHALREYASGVTFDPKLIERERGVVLSEMATRDTPESRAGDYNIQLLWPTAREVRRRVIGDADQIRGFQRDQFIAFYDAWYRPERLALIIVGDVDAATALRLVTAEFAGLKARAPARPEPADLVTRTSAPPDVGVFRDPGTVGLWLCFEHPRWSPRLPDTHAEREKRLHEALAFEMFALRLRKLASAPNASFVGPSASVSSGLRNWDVATVGVNGRIDDWKTVAEDLEFQHRTAVQFGFTPAELAEARAAVATTLEQAKRSAATRPSPWLAHQLVGTLINGTVFSTPEAVQRDLTPALAATRLSDCLAAFRAAWLPKAPTVYAVSNAGFAITRAQLAAVLNESRERPVTRPSDVALPEFAYTNFGPPGKVVRDERAVDLDAHLAEFANAVRFNFKPTKYEADAVQVRVRVGTGKMSQLKSQPGIDLLADAGFLAGGVGRHTQQELSDILTGHAVQLSFQVETDALEFYAHCAPRDLLLALRIIAAYITDPGYRPEAMRQARAEYGAILSKVMASPGGPITMAATRELFDHDTRFGIATVDEFAARDLGELRAWLDLQLQDGPIETSLVGDISWEQAREAIGATLGALAPRQAVKDQVAAVPAVFAEHTNELKVYAIEPTMKQVALAWYWPVPEAVPVREERRCYLLAAVLGERLRVKLREELGATYAPAAGFSHLDGFPLANYFACYAEVAPKQVKSVLEILARESKSLSEKGPTADEFERAREPYLRSMAEDLQTNAYWGATVLEDAQQRPSRIAAARNRAADIAAITRADLTALAQRFLDPRRAYKFATVPAPPRK